MKKITALLLCLVMALVLAACGGTKDDGDGAEADFQSQLATAGVITVGISPDYPPMETYDEQGNVVGFDVDFLNALLPYIGDGSCEIQLVPMEFDTIVSAVQTGTVDIGCSGFTYDAERDVLFSDAYVDSAQVVLVAADSGVSSVDELQGAKVGAQLGTTGADAAAETFGADNVITQTDAGLLFESLKSGGIAAVVCDVAVANYYAESGDFTVLDEPLLDESVMMIAANGNTLLMDEINAAIAEFKASDDYAALLEEWGQ